MVSGTLIDSVDHIHRRRNRLRRHFGPRNRPNLKNIKSIVKVK
jgi:hypothetical protein